ncbi:MAG: UvrD-helicase domain-containing protein [Cyanobacteriota bacterium]|nr:UvrD-helicase domain-containing protein [Cyanobacteriota bacterium]
MDTPVTSARPPAIDEPADFDPNRFPLDPGLRLLEASAGTGKTFALAHLALRLVTERAIPLRRLLVVTFTDAAATELRERIGRRLQEALSCLRDPTRTPPDPVLAEWLTRQRRNQAEGTVAEMRLLLALEELDGADITTIHGFCQRSLRRHALEARRPPDLRLDNAGDTLLEQVVHSYWQEQVLRLPASLIEGLRRKGVKPETLTALLRSLDGDPGLELDPLPPASAVDTPLAEALPGLWHAAWQRFIRAWRREGHELMAALFSQAREWKAAGLAYKPYVLKETSRWNHAVVESLITAGQTDPAQSDTMEADWATPGYELVLRQEMLTTFLHPGTFCKTARALEGLATGGPEERPIALPHRPLMEAVAHLVDGPAELALLHACHWGRRELTRRRQRLGLCSYAQLLSDLDPGPDATAPTPLLAAVAERYDAALIDEFQDTDPIQWRILRLAFGGGHHLLVMVGDPKQAIYRFRGGDLDTYLAARDRADARYAMRDNRRSTPELIAALNQLCARGLARSGLAPMPVLTAKASRGGDGQTPLDLLWLGAPWPAATADPPEPAAGPSAPCPPTSLPTSTDLSARLPRQMASYVAHLLRDPPLLREGETDRLLEPADICLLVSTHAQAEGLRQALRHLGIPSRLVSQADVFATPAATALQRLLDALAEPSDANRLRLLAASPLLGWSADTIATASPLRWSTLAARLQQLAQTWPRQGLLGPLAAVLGAEPMARLSTGGRFLADLQQAAELLQQRLHRDRLGPQAAARWLRRRRLQEVDTIPEAEQTHSDKVRQAVAVVTVHRSKGLEYPLVICPYLWLDAGRSQGEGRRWHPHPGGAPRLDLHRNRHWGPGWQADRHARLEEDAERERLAYVALTRAMHRLVLAWVPAKGRQCNPLTPWLFPDDDLLDPATPWQETNLERWRQRLEEEIHRRQLPLRLLEPPAPPPPGWRAVSGNPALAPEALAVGPIPRWPLDRSWARSSYTSWTHERHPPAPPTETPTASPQEASPQEAETQGAPPQGAETQGAKPQRADILSVEALEEGRDVADPDPWDHSAPPPPAAAAAPPEAPPSPWPDRGLWADLPAGSGFGDCLHRLLEQIDYDAALSDPASQRLAAHELRRAGLSDTLAEPLLAAVRQMLATPFGGPLGTLRPADLPRRQRLNELHFDLSLQQAQASDLADAFRRHPGGLFGADYAAALAQLPVHHRGFLTGSLDLVFPAHADGQERWWVLDWKSNRLGRRDERGQCLSCGPGDYGPEALRDLMASHHYPLQAHLYLVALHRYLAWRLPGYDPRRHLGGYVYVFVRGTPGAAATPLPPGPVPGMLVERPPLARLLALDGALGCAPPGWQPGSIP